MKFCTAINCMDGRVQIPVIRYLQDRFGADCVDVVSEPGPNRILAEGTEKAVMDSIRKRAEISVQKHHSVGIAVIGHHDCAGNPASAEEQRKQTAAGVSRIRSWFDHVEVIGLWVNKEWEVSELQDH